MSNGQETTGESAPLSPGTRVSHYEIVSELGRGGMGVVYRARDLDLSREVALKHPWPHLASDERVQRRFRREARAAARLMHPNVVPVLEVFREGGHDWLVMELVEGRSLRSLLREKGPLSLEEILRHGEALADALHAAHGKGVLHRDINPKNILIDDRGEARLTDFGLARVFSAELLGSAGSTQSGSVTSEGAVLGTLLYMSPEQALGKEVDTRSDLYSLGAVLYEMCTGEPLVSPGERGTVLDAVLHGEPRSIARLNYEVPEELERIVRKCLRKRSDERYQDVRQIQADLRALRRQIQSDEIVREAAAPSRRLWYAAAALALLAVAVLAAGWLWPRGEPAAVISLTNARRLTSGPGWEAEAVLSPDGGFLAYVSEDSGNADLWLQDVKGGAALQLTTDPARDREPGWFPDGGAIVFASERGGRWSIWKVPRLGGPATLLVEHGASPSLSPDGKFLAFSRLEPGGHLRIAVAPLEDPSRTTLLTDDEDGLWDHRHPAWSPDGRTICYADARTLWLVPSAGGEARQLTPGGFGDTEPVWSSDGRHIYFSSSRDGVVALWRVAVSGGEPVRLTPGSGPERGPSISEDGSRLSYSTLVDDPDLVVLDLRTGERHRVGSVGAEAEVSIAPDNGEIAFVSNRLGRVALWAQPLVNRRPEGPPRQLTDHPGTAANPKYSPDGRWIAYHRVLEGQRDIWIIPAEGGPPLQFTSDPAIDVQPNWSPDGARIAFVSDRDGRDHVWIKPVQNGRPAGEAQRLTSGDTADDGPAWSADGWIAYTAAGAEGTDVYVIREEGGQPWRVTEGADPYWVRWEPGTGQLLVSGTWGTGNLRLVRVPSKGGSGDPFDPPVEFGSLKTGGDFDVSRDGSLLVYTRDEASGDVWMLESTPGTF